MVFNKINQQDQKIKRLAINSLPIFFNILTLLKR